MTKLYLDDIRTPHESHGFTVVRNFADFVTYIVCNGIPDVISFDHDLADHHYQMDDQQWTEYPKIVEESPEDINYAEFIETGYDIAKWLVNYCEENNLKLKEVYIHSMNPVGSQNIMNVLNPFMQKTGNPSRVRRGSACIEPVITK